jgi:hypothetical protein
MLIWTKFARHELAANGSLAMTYSFKICAYSGQWPSICEKRMNFCNVKLAAYAVVVLELMA